LALHWLNKYKFTHFFKKKKKKKKKKKSTGKREIFAFTLNEMSRTAQRCPLK